MIILTNACSSPFCEWSTLTIYVGKTCPKDGTHRVSKHKAGISLSYLHSFDVKNHASSRFGLCYRVYIQGVAGKAISALCVMPCELHVVIPQSPGAVCPLGEQPIKHGTMVPSNGTRPLYDSNRHGKANRFHANRHMLDVSISEPICAPEWFNDSIQYRMINISSTKIANTNPPLHPISAWFR